MKIKSRSVFGYWLFSIVFCFFNYQIKSQPSHNCYSTSVGSPFQSSFYGPNLLFTEDMNNDGKLDFITINNVSAGGDVSFLPGLGTGSFVSYYTTYGGAEPTAGTIGDFNGDGNKDIAVTGSTNNYIVTLLGQGNGGFNFAYNHLITWPHYVCNSDFNNDGNIDLAVTHHWSNYISILNGTGTGSFTPTFTYSIGNFLKTIKTRDLNSDNFEDLIMCNNDSIAVLLGASNGSFLSPMKFQVGANPSDFTTNDLNNDGIVDIAVSNFQTNNVSILLGVGNGSFQSVGNFSVGVWPRSITSCDLNNDGIVDLATANWNTSNMSVLMGQGNGVYFPPVNHSAGQYPTSLVNGDFNMDGSEDLAVLNHGTRDIDVYINTNTSTLSIFSSSTAICPGQTCTLTAAGAITYTWNNSSNSNSIIINPTVQTTYTVIGFTSNGCNNSAVYTQSMTACAGLFENKQEINNIIFPNPSKDFIFLRTNNYLGIEIINYFGDKVLNDYVDGKKDEIDIRSLNPGVYLICIMSEYKKEYLKIVKE